MAFLDTRTGALIAGDAFQTKGGIAVAGQLRPGFPFPALATWHQRTALESAKKLGKHRPSLLAPGHGPMRKQPGDSIERALRSEEHTSEIQSRENLACRLLLEKKKIT